MTRVKKISKVIILLIVAFIFLNPLHSSAQNGNNFEISKNLDIFSNLYKEIEINYVDEINPGDFMLKGINAMLKDLDPYTVFIPESQIEDYRFMTTGQYGGIGATVYKFNDDIVISQPYQGFPADKAGLKAGDKILEINGQSTRGRSIEDVNIILKGQAGSDVKFLIERYGEAEPFEKTVTREVVKIDNIPYYGMLKDSVAYIKLTGFTMNAGNEFKKAFEEMRDNNNVRGIICDLRGNGGGLLHEAVNISNIFVEKGKLIVSTKGKLSDKNNSYKTMQKAVDKEIPLVVLVDKSSASASEIVAGAMQDLDRGVILGQRSFGKGLVQNVLPLSYNNQVKVTVAKYYIPSGRCIQAIDYSHKDMDGNFGKIPDSLITAFKTENGRIVYDGGGVDPDVKIPPVKYNPVVRSLLSQFQIFDFATKFAYENDSIAPPDEFEIDDNTYNQFKKFLKEREFKYTTDSEYALEKLKELCSSENYFGDIKNEYDVLLSKLDSKKSKDLDKYSKLIKSLLKEEIISRYYYDKGRIIGSLASDPEILKAIEIINDKERYNAILAGTTKEPN